MVWVFLLAMIVNGEPTSKLKISYPNRVECLNAMQLAGALTQITGAKGSGIKIVGMSCTVEVGA
jgi:hypothetical protein